MIPSTVATFIGFLLFIAPGLLYEILSERYRPPFEQTTFREISRIALFSVIFSGVATTTLVIVRAIWPETMPDPRLWLAHPSSYLESRYRLIGRAAVCEVGLALVLAYVAYRIRYRDHSTRHAPHSLLWTVFRESSDNPAPGNIIIPYVALRMDDGSVLLGELAAGESSSQELSEKLALSPPLSVIRDGRTVESVEPFKRLVVKLDNVKEMYVEYREFPRPPRRRWWDRLLARRSP